MFCSHIYDGLRLKCLLALALVFSQVSCSGGDGGIGSEVGEGATVNMLGVSWTAPLERVDITPLSPSEIAGYRIYYGTDSGDYQNQIEINDGSMDQAQVLDIPAGTYYVVVTAIDTDGRESAYSSEVAITV